jgi:hypothetical protein
VTAESMNAQRDTELMFDCYHNRGGRGMNASSPTHVGWRSFIIPKALIPKVLIIVGVCAGLSVPAYCKSSDISLFVQQTPDGGGATNPVSGVYHFAPNSQVTLTATANPGYQFVYWLGDVSSPEALSTVVHLDKPKIVIAVFEQSQAKFTGGGIPGGGGGLTTTGSNLSAGGGLSSTTGAKPQKQVVAYAPSGDKAPQVPEPATGILLALGSVFLLKNRRRRIRFHRS